MKILEVRDGFIKFEADKSIYLSSFIRVDGTAKSYIAQVNQIRNLGSVYMASAKILFLLDNNELKNYDKTLPSPDAEIKTFTKDILINSIKAEKPIIAGKTLDGDLNITINSSAFNKKMLICVDSPELNNILARNFAKQFENVNTKTIIIDTLGIINAKKYTAGKDFKLPLNTNALSFMYESCLNDATAESKSTIVEIFRELAEYSQSVPFVPFETLKNIVDNMVEKQHIFKLLILKNKLAKFQKLGYFASKKEEVDKLDKILQSNCTIIDLSSLNPLFQNNYLEYLYEKFDSYKNIQVFLETSNTISKKNLKKVMIESEIPTTIITHSKFKYLNDIKNLFDNFIIEPGISNNQTFKVYSSFLSSMKKNCYLTTGEATNYIPLISEALIIDETIPYAEKITEEENTLQEDIQSETDSDITENPPLDTNEPPENEIYEDNNKEEDNEEIIDIAIDEEEDADEEVNNSSNEDNPANEQYEYETIENTEEEEEEEEEENFIEEESGLTNEEVLAAIEEKADSAIASVTEDLVEPETLTLFSESDDNENSDTDNDTNETVQQSEEELSEELDTLEEDNETDDFDNTEELNENIEQDDSQMIEPEYTEVYENDNSFRENLEEENIAEEDFDGLNEDSEIISNIEDENIIQDENSVLDELSEAAEDENILEEINDSDNDTYNSDDLIIEEDNLSEELLDTDTETENEEILSDENPEEETLVELDNDTNTLLEESEETIKEEDLPVNNIDVDLSEPQVLPLAGEGINHDFDEIVELDASESNDEDIIVDLSDNNGVEELDEEVEQQIIEDVDKVYTTMKNEDTLEEISDSDLDLIDELNNDGEELEEYTGEELEEISDSGSQDDIINEIHEYESGTKKENHNDSGEILEKRDSNTPIVPVYDADIPQEDMVMSDPIQQGDAVTHVKYGNGVVEKMIKYGSKTLFAINFENIGRRLLDPTLTEIKKV